MKTTQKLLEKAAGLADLAMDDPNPQIAMALTQIAIANALIAIALQLQVMNKNAKDWREWQVTK